MHLSRIMLLSVASACLVFLGVLGCSKQEVKTDQGQIKAQQPSEDNQKTPASASTEDQSKRNISEAPPGPKEQPEPADALRDEQSLKDIHFALDSSEIKPGEAGLLEDDYRHIKSGKISQVTIEGHCDERGTVEYNLALGERRADAARTYLVAMGADASRLNIISYGKSKPADPGHDEAAWAKNRRDHFVVR